MAALTNPLAQAHGVTRAILRSKQRSPIWLSPIRQEAWYLIYATGRFSYGQIGRYFGGRDHTTIMYGIAEYRARRLRTALQLAA